MSEVTQLLATIKRQLKLQGKTYRDVAAALDLSEASVKRLLTADTLGIDRVVEIGHLLGFTLAELAQEAAVGQTRLRTVTPAQETELVSDPRLLLVAVCALNHWTLADMLAAYRFTEAECLRQLLVLDRLRLIVLMPGNRIRPNVARDFDWLADGPIRAWFRAQGLADFLDHGFDGDDGAFAFAHGMLTEVALATLQTELRRLRARFAELHEESLASPLPKRRGSGLLLALREWEPAAFAALRR